MDFTLHLTWLNLVLNVEWLNFSFAWNQPDLIFHLDKLDFILQFELTRLDLHMWPIELYSLAHAYLAKPLELTDSS